MNRQSFIGKLEGPRNGNFSESFRAGNTELAWAGYQLIANQLSNLAAEAEKLGVRVFRSMTLKDLETASGQSQVTIISHSRSALFRPSDLVDELRIRAGIPELRDSKALLNDATGLAEFLNKHYFPVRDKSDQNIGAPIQFQAQLIAIRQQLTGKLPGAFRGGAGIELYGGFESFDSIASQFPSAFAGVVDLIVCNSLFLAELLRNRCPRALVIATSDLTFPETRLPFYLATIRLLARSPRPYEDAVQELKIILRKEFA